MTRSGPEGNRLREWGASDVRIGGHPYRLNRGDRVDTPAATGIAHVLLAGATGRVGNPTKRCAHRGS